MQTFILLMQIAMVALGVRSPIVPAVPPPVVQEDIPEVVAVPSPTAVVSPVPSAMPVIVPPTPQSTPRTTPLAQANGDMVYPGATVSIKTGNDMQLSVAAAFDAVVTWYEQRLDEKAYTQRSTVRTTTNGTQHAVLVRKTGTTGYRVTIDQEASATLVRILVAREE